MKKTILITIAIILVLSGAVLAAEITETVTKEEPVTEVETVEFEEMKTINQKSDFEFVTELVNKGYEADWLLDIYDFYLTCGEDISIVESIYTASEEYDITGRNWIETSYNIATDGIHGELSLNDVMMYVSKGVSEEDIAAANVICRSGAGTIQEILDLVVEGESIEKIADAIYGNNGTTVETMAKMKKLGIEKEEDLKSVNIVLELQEAADKAAELSVLSDETISRYPDFSKRILSNAEKLSEDKGLELDTVLKEYKETGKYSKYIDR